MMISEILGDDWPQAVRRIDAALGVTFWGEVEIRGNGLQQALNLLLEVVTRVLIWCLQGKRRNAILNPGLRMRESSSAID